jgi:hypothetical protein
MGWDWILMAMNPSQNHSGGRKILLQSLGSTTLPQYDHVLVSDLIELFHSIRRFSTRSMRQYSGHSASPSPSKSSLESINPVGSITHAVASIVIRITYGDGVFRDIGEQLIALNMETVRQLNWVAGQFWPVEYLPFCMCHSCLVMLTDKKFDSAALASVVTRSSVQIGCTNRI